jgi:HSP20 family protein
MDRTTFELMFEQVRAIYHAVTGHHMPAPPEQGAAQGDPQWLSESIRTHFAELDAWARLLPDVAERVPPFAFAPSIDIVEREKEFIVEIALPGVARKDVEVEAGDGRLTVHGIRIPDDESRINGFGLRHAEIPRGPFRRTIALPHEAGVHPLRIDEPQHGILRVHLPRMGSQAKA